MAGIKIKPEDVSKVLKGRAKATYKAMGRAAYKGAQKSRTTLVAKTPVDRGQLRNAWRAKRGDRTDLFRTGTGGKILAQLVNDRLYAGVMEKGARPHPVSRKGREALARWASRKLGLGRQEAERVSWAIAQKIKREGFEGVHFVRDSLDDIRKDAALAIVAEVRKLARRRLREDEKR